MKSVVACRDIDPLLSAYVDHEASPAEALLVEEHTQTCADCQARLHRMRRFAPDLERQVQAHLSQGEKAAAALNRAYQPLPETMVAQNQVPFFSRFATVGVLAVFAAFAAFVLLRSAPTNQPLPTAAQPTAQTPALSGPLVGISIDGLVDPPTASYVHRVIADAEEQHASVIVWLAPSGGLGQTVDQVSQELADSSVPIYAYAPSQNPTATTLAQSAQGTLGAIPAGASIAWRQMDFGEAVWHRVLDPTTAYLFFVLGLYAVFLEIAHPGSLVPGITGLVALAIAAVAFSSLPINWLGVLALVAGVGLMALELKASTHGLLLACGVACLAVGSLALYARPGFLSPLVLAGVVVLGVILGVVLARVASGVRRLPPISPLQDLVGARGTARTALSPNGVVHVNGQTWSAHARGAPVAAGEPVRVLARRGLTLDVESASFRAAATQKGAYP